jgi:hypothetical protein
MQRIKSKQPEMLLALSAVLGLAVCAILYTFGDGISGNDFWWHIKVGQWIVENGRIPTTDIFSWYGTENQIPWTAHEWLADVMFYLLHEACGQWGIFLLSLASALTMTALLWKEAVRHVQRNVLIGGVFFAKHRPIPLRAAGVVLGAILFRLVYGLALRLNMPAFMLKLVSSVIVVIAISGPYLRRQLPLIIRRWRMIREGRNPHA